MERMVVNIERYGNTSSGSIPISLDEVVRNGRLKKGEKFSMVAFGGGATWGSVVSEWNPDLAFPANLRKLSDEIAVGRPGTEDR